jgi:ABC-type sugar transport system ATPase subunit
MEYLLELKGITKNFQSRCSQNVDFSIQKGEIRALWGNGAGKSTLINSKTGLSTRCWFLYFGWANR